MTAAWGPAVRCPDRPGVVNMSHDLAGLGERAEPNLVPLLDVVFQLIMFFMMCVNFVTEQINEDIQLPDAQSARPMEKSEADVLFLNLNPEGHLLATGREAPLERLSEMKFYLEKEYEDARRLAKERGDRSGQVRTVIIIRADRAVDYVHVYQLLRLCKEVGYRKYQLRAKTKN
jgi:biopolymer transport protein ExbD